jgi:glycerol-3-phosphate cytidylyltransferase-like family protein
MATFGDSQIHAFIPIIIDYLGPIQASRLRIISKRFQNELLKNEEIRQVTQASKILTKHRLTHSEKVYTMDTMIKHIDENTSTHFISKIICDIVTKGDNIEKAHASRFLCDALMGKHIYKWNRTTYIDIAIMMKYANYWKQVKKDWKPIYEYISNNYGKLYYKLVDSNEEASVSEMKRIAAGRKKVIIKTNNPYGYVLS